MSFPLKPHVRPGSFLVGPPGASRPEASSHPAVRLLLAVLIVLSSACRASLTETPDQVTDEGSVAVVTLHPEHEFQTIHGFGASDAWSSQFVGRSWPLEKRERMADLLFELGLSDDGSPRGIGLSIWRFNIGAGSAEQGSDSGIRDEWRRAESFLRDDGTFDPTRQAGQRWFLRAAAERGVERFVGFVNSPPVHFTRNGRAFSAGGVSTNLRADRFDEFAGFLTDVVRHLEREDGVRLTYLSPFNEPQWDWEGGQEGTPWTNHEIRDAVRAIDAAFRQAGVATRIEIPEAAKLTYLYETADKPERGDQAAAFFDPSSPVFIGDLPHVARKVAGHSYFTTFPADTLHEVRDRLRRRVEEVDPELEFWMTEYCVLENNSRIRGPGRDLGMHAALYVAEVIHADLTVARASSWQWWLGISPYDYKDGLVYIDRSQTDGEIYESKLLWTLGHFSRFVRPGMKRIGTDTDAASASPILASAYRDPETEALVSVLINPGDRDLSVRLSGAAPTRATRAYLTSAEAGMDLRLQPGWRPFDGFVLPSRSLVTLVID